MRCSTPGMRTPAKSKYGISRSSMPRAKIRTLRLKILRCKSPFPFPSSFFRDSAKEIATPTMNTKKGKTRSVGVQPCHSAWRSGG